METNLIAKNTLFLLKNRIDLLLYESSEYSCIANFISGYEQGISLILKNSVLSFNEWIKQNEKKKFSLNWPHYVLQKNNGDEEKAKDNSIDLFEKYLNYIIEEIENNAGALDG